MSQFIDELMCNFFTRCQKLVKSENLSWSVVSSVVLQCCMKNLENEDARWVPYLLLAICKEEASLVTTMIEAFRKEAKNKGRTQKSRQIAMQYATALLAHAILGKQVKELLGPFLIKLANWAIAKSKKPSAHMLFYNVFLGIIYALVKHPEQLPLSTFVVECRLLELLNCTFDPLKRMNYERVMQFADLVDRSVSGTSSTPHPQLTDLKQRVEQIVNDLQTVIRNGGMIRRQQQNHFDKIHGLDFFPLHPKDIHHTMFLLYISKDESLPRKALQNNEDLNI
jgi:hypothetical protein